MHVCVPETVTVVHISSQFTHFFFLPSHCGHIVGHVGLHLSLVCLFLAFSFILRHISAEALPHPVPSEYFVDLTWRVMMDKLIQTSEGCAHCSESQERFCLHTHTHEHLHFQRPGHHLQIIKTWQCVISQQAYVALREGMCCLVCSRR